MTKSKSGKTPFDDVRTCAAVVSSFINEREFNTRAEVLKDWYPGHRVTLHRAIRAGEFPPPIWISKGRAVWRLSTLHEWMAEREKHPIRPRAYFRKAAKWAGRGVRLIP